jgi:hypothetical protein
MGMGTEEYGEARKRDSGVVVLQFFKFLYYKRRGRGVARCLRRANSNKRIKLNDAREPCIWPRSSRKYCRLGLEEVSIISSGSARVALILFRPSSCSPCSLVLHPLLVKFKSTSAD